MTADNRMNDSVFGSLEKGPGGDLESPDVF